MTEIFHVEKFFKAIVVNRPSKIIKSPYLADIKLFNENNEIIDENHIAHSPALGCCGLIVKDTIVYLVKSDNENRKSKYTIYNVEIKNPNIIIGVNPNIANNIFQNIIEKNLLEFDFLNNKSIIKREKKIFDSRIDFLLEFEDKKIYIEIKNVPLADFVDVDKKERKNYKNEDYNEYEKISIFPDGYRKKTTDLISPRAYKHLDDLIKINELENHYSYIIYIIQRHDIKFFKPTIIDEQYNKKFYEAKEKNVKIIPIVVKWIDNKLYFDKIVKIL